MQQIKRRKPESERLKVSVQVLFKDHEYKILDRIRRESNFSTIASFCRMILLKEIEKKKQTELF